MNIVRSMYESMPNLMASEAGPSSVRDFERLTWRKLDYLEMTLLAVGGLLVATFTFAMLADVVTRQLGISVTWLQELVLSTFVWGLFLGGAVAVRRRLHFKVTAMVDSMVGRRRRVFETVNHGVVLIIALWMIGYGFQNFLMGTTIYQQPSGNPVGIVTAAIPVCGLLVALFTVEALVNGWRRGFAAPATAGQAADQERSEESGGRHE